jgi:hypothetical protein
VENKQTSSRNAAGDAPLHNAVLVKDRNGSLNGPTEKTKRPATGYISTLRCSQQTSSEVVCLHTCRRSLLCASALEFPDSDRRHLHELSHSRSSRDRLPKEAQLRTYAVSNFNRRVKNNDGP